MDRAIRAFFDTYVERMNTALATGETDVGALQALYADYLVGSSPAGVIGGDNASLAEIFPAMIERYRAIGGTAFELKDVRVTRIDDVHASAEIDWAFAYDKDGKSGVIPFTNRYYLSLTSGDPRVFAFISPDEDQAIKDHGLA